MPLPRGILPAGGPQTKLIGPQLRSVDDLVRVLRPSSLPNLPSDWSSGGSDE